MQASHKIFPTPPRQLKTAANQDFVHVTIAKPASGWDPYEVWQRMIKEPRARRLADQR